MITKKPRPIALHSDKSGYVQLGLEAKDWDQNNQHFVVGEVASFCSRFVRFAFPDMPRDVLLRRCKLVATVNPSDKKRNFHVARATECDCNMHLGLYGKHWNGYVFASSGVITLSLSAFEVVTGLHLDEGEIARVQFNVEVL